MRGGGGHASTQGQGTAAEEAERPVPPSPYCPGLLRGSQPCARPDVGPQLRRHEAPGQGSICCQPPVCDVWLWWPCLGTRDSRVTQGSGGLGHMSEICQDPRGRYLLWRNKPSLRLLRIPSGRARGTLSLHADGRQLGRCGVRVMRGRGGDAGQHQGLQPAHRSHKARQPPLRAQEAVAVQPAAAVHAALQHIDSHDTGVHRIRVLPHGSLDDCVPWVAGGRNDHAT